MGYFFVGLSYIFQTLIIDMAIVANVILINNFYIRSRSNFYYNNSAKYYMGILLAIDLLIIGLCFMFFFDLLISSLIIILSELTLAGMGYVLVLLISTSIETWFDYIIWAGNKSVKMIKFIYYLYSIYSISHKISTIKNQNH